MSDKPSREELEAQIAALEWQLAALKAGAGGAAAIARSAAATEESAAATEGAIAIAGNVLGPIFHLYQVAPGRGRLSETEFAHILADYLGWVMREYGRARLHGLQTLTETGPLSRPLSAVYTSLVVRRYRMGQPPPTFHARRPLELKGIEESGEMVAPQPIDMADLLTLKDRIAIVGGAGSGKTTYLSFVAASLATALTGQPLDTRLKPNRPGDPLPVPILSPLRFWKVYRDACAQEPQRLLDQPEAAASG